MNKAAFIQRCSNRHRGSYRCKLSAQGGFSLIELIVVIAIMAVLLGLLAPSFMHYLDRNKRTACKHNREAILDLYSTYVHDSATPISINDADISNVVGGKFSFCKDDIDKYQCPKKGAYTGFISSSDASVACIECDECGDTVSLDMIVWASTKSVAGLDSIITPTPAPHVTEEPEEPTPTPTSPPAQEVEHGKDWPYPDLEEWWNGKSDMGGRVDLSRGNYPENDVNNLYLYLKTPSGEFVSDKTGLKYVFIDTNNSGAMQIYYKEAASPDYYSQLYPQYLIQLSGTVKKVTLSKEHNTITNMTNGDIYEITIDGKTDRYVYFHQAGGGQSESIGVDAFMKGDNKNGNFYRVGP